MTKNRITGYVIGAVVGIISLSVVIHRLDSLFTSSAALEPGDPQYSSQQEIINGLNTILPWLAPGAIGAIALILILLKDSY